MRLIFFLCCVLSSSAVEVRNVWTNTVFAVRLSDGLAVAVGVGSSVTALALDSGAGSHWSFQQYSPGDPLAPGQTVAGASGDALPGVYSVYQDSVGVLRAEWLPGLDEPARAQAIVRNGLWYGFLLGAFFATWWSVKAMWKSFQGGDSMSD